MTPPRSVSRMMLWQAQERYPDVIFAPLGGAVAHALIERYSPSLLCTTRCGRLGFVEDLVVEVDDVFPVCIQCAARLADAVAPATRLEGSA